VTTSIEGASVVEEVTSLPNQVMSVLTIFCLYHGGENGIVMQKLLPPFQDLLHKPPSFLHPPLMEENHHRVAHLDGAMKHLDDKSAELARQCKPCAKRRSPRRPKSSCSVPPALVKQPIPVFVRRARNSTQTDVPITCMVLNRLFLQAG